MVAPNYCSRVAVGLTALAIAACSTGGGARAAQIASPRGSYLVDETTIAAGVESCNAHPVITKLDETESEVRVEVTATFAPTSFFGGGRADCQDGVTVTLEEPLGDRAIVDLSTGEAVEPQTEDPAGSR